jgi:hypothetical protein
MPGCLATYGYSSYGDSDDKGYFSLQKTPSYAIPFVQQNSLKQDNDDDTKFKVGLGIGLGLGVPIVVALSVYAVYLYRRYTKIRGYIPQL